MLAAKPPEFRRPAVELRGWACAQSSVKVFVARGGVEPSTFRFSVVQTEARQPRIPLVRATTRARTASEGTIRAIAKVSHGAARDASVTTGQMSSGDSFDWGYMIRYSIRSDTLGWGQ
jgi:hypothetical protein